MEDDKLIREQNGGEALANGDGPAIKQDESAAEQREKVSRESDKTDDVELKDLIADDKKEDADKVTMAYDEAVAKYATGRYQIVIFILLCVVTFSTSYNNNGYVFIGASQSHTCKVPSASNWTDEENRTATLTYAADTCTYSTYAQYDNETLKQIGEETECDSWDYDQSEFTLTMMSEWDLNSCHGKWKIAFANSMFMIGFFIGCIVLADLSDRYGRSLLLLISNVCMIISGVVASFSVNYEMLVVMRFVLGIFTAGARNAAFVYVCEIMKDRAVAGMIHGPVYSLGGLAVTGISHMFPNWRHFQLACAVSYVLYIPYYWVMSESPRWMLSQGRTEEANAYFYKSARINKVDIPKNLTVYLEHQPKSEGNVLTLFKTANLRKKSLIVCLLWFSVSIVFFGMNFNVGNLSGNIFTNNYLLHTSGVFVFVGIWYIKLGRRPAIASAFLVASLVSGILPVFAIYDIRAAVVAMGMIGKFLFEVNFEMVYIITAELYPTSARVTALGMGSGFARLGGAISPYLVLSHDVWPNLPYIIFAGIALITGLFAILLPETKGKQLPDSLDQAETENPLSSCNCCKRQSTDNAFDVDSEATCDNKL